MFKIYSKMDYNDNHSAGAKDVPCRNYFSEKDLRIPNYTIKFITFW